MNNHSHLLVTINITYDAACFLTDGEYYLKHKGQINIRAAVEKSYLCILVRCPSNDLQILYSEERVSDIFKISEPLQSYNGLEIYDVLTSFKGDSPARQFEAGYQKGGNFVCIACPIHGNYVKTLFLHSEKKV